jgi:hypothetical protein
MYQSNIVFDAKLSLDMVSVGIDGLGTSVQLVSNFACGKPLPDHAENLQLTIRQAVGWFR